MSQLQLAHWIRTVLNPAHYDTDIGSMLEAASHTDRLSGLGEGTPILIRADLDVPISGGVVKDATRLESFANSLLLCKARKWKPVLLGHVGRRADNVAAPIAAALEDLYGRRVSYVENWFDNSKIAVTQQCEEAVACAGVGELVLLENTRKYDFETALWEFDPREERLNTERLHAVTSSVRSAIARNYIFDALAASNPDWSSVVVPAYMDNAVISDDLLDELEGNVMAAREAEALVFSGTKMDKLADLDGILKQHKVRLLVIGGALAMPFRKALAVSGGLDCGIGSADSPRVKGEPYYVADEHVRIARDILNEADEHEVEVVLPEDFVLDNGAVADDVPAGRLQMDIGPKSAELFEARLFEFVRSSPRRVVFFNGVMGKFEEQQFAEGTRRMVSALRKLTGIGAMTYVGGGEGRLALERYGATSWVTHAFTAGGTVLKAMSGRVIGYLSALAQFNRRESSVQDP